MYIIELFYKLIEDYKSGKFKKQKNAKEPEEKCSHMFIPIDSTGKILACSKCGEIYKKDI